MATWNEVREFLGENLKQHIGVMESLDSIELLAPIRLMAGEIVTLKEELGLS